MIVIPMAGESRRFKLAGYDAPKYMLPLEGRPLFDWALLSFAAYFASEPFLFILRDVSGAPAFVAERLKQLGVQTAHIVVLEDPTAGQAETVEIGLERAGVRPDEPLAIFNIDTIRPGIDIAPPAGCMGWLEVFEAEGDGWSFIEPMSDQPDRVARCVEKIRISDYCCTGFYQFVTASLFTEALAAERASPSSHELFVAPMYNHLIARGVQIGWRKTPSDKVILSGVPAEYEVLLTHMPKAMKAMI